MEPVALLGKESRATRCFDHECAANLFPEIIALKRYYARTIFRFLNTSLSLRLTHARSLRVIGQKLEVTKISQFQLEHDGEIYTVTNDLMSRTAEWILRYATTQDTVAPDRRPVAHTVVNLNPITFSQADLIRLDLGEAKRRRELLEAQPPTKLSHRLRIVGAQLDKNAARTFSIFWTPNSAVVDYSC